MFSPADYLSMYSRIMGPLAEPIEVLVNQDGTYISYTVNAHVSRYKESDLIAGGTIQLGDVRLIVLWEDLQALGITARMGLKDRVNIGDRTFAVVHWDENTRTVGADNVAVEITVRGGGSAIIASILVRRITGSGDNRITGDGDYRAVREAVGG